MVNKGLALFQWKQDIGAAEICCQEALEIDPECEAAVATLAQLCLQQSKIDTAVELFKRQLELARSEPELANTLTYMYASIAQKTFLEVSPYGPEFGPYLTYHYRTTPRGNKRFRQWRRLWYHRGLSRLFLRWHHEDIIFPLSLLTVYIIIQPVLLLL